MTATERIQKYIGELLCRIAELEAALETAQTKKPAPEPKETNG